jgi:hypothetical protein
VIIIIFAFPSPLWGSNFQGTMSLLIISESLAFSTDFDTKLTPNKHLLTQYNVIHLEILVTLGQHLFWKHPDKKGGEALGNDERGVNEWFGVYSPVQEGTMGVSARLSQLRIASDYHITALLGKFFCCLEIKLKIYINASCVRNCQGTKCSIFWNFPDYRSQYLPI